MAYGVGGGVYGVSGLATPASGPITTGYQGLINGLTFGNQSYIQLIQIDGLRDATSIQTGDQFLPRLDGAAPGVNTLGERVLVLQFQTFNPTVGLETILAGLTMAFQPTDSPAALQTLQFFLPGWASARQVTGRTTKGAIPVDHQYQYGVPTVSIEFTCPDPLIYDTTLQSASTGLPSPTAGLTFPVTFPVTFGASTGGSFQLSNQGNYPAPIVATINGPCTNPLITLGSLTLGFTISLAATDSLVIDTGGRTAILNGTASRTNTIMSGSTWFTLPVGTSSLGFQSSDSAAVAATCTGQVRSTWGFM